MNENIFNDKWDKAQTVTEKQNALKSQFGFIPSVLYLDDEKDLLDIFKVKMTQLGFDVYTTADYREALLYISQYKDKLAIIFSDYKMPDVSGLEFRRMILSETSHIPFFIISGYTNSETVLASVGIKVSGFFDKPFHADQIIHYYKRKQISTDVLMEADAFLEKNENFELFWKNKLEKIQLTISLLSSEQSKPILADLIDMDEENISIQIKESASFNQEELFVKFNLVQNAIESKFLVKSKLENSFFSKNDQEEDVYQLEMVMSDLKKEDFEKINFLIQERQVLISQYLDSAHKLEKNK